MTTPQPPILATARAIADAHTAGQPITELLWQLTRDRRAELLAAMTPPAQEPRKRGRR